MQGRSHVFQVGLAAFDECLRLLTSGLVAYYCFRKGLGVGHVATIAVILFAFLVMLPPALVTAYDQWAKRPSFRILKVLRWLLGPKASVARKGPLFRWLIRGFFCLLMAICSFIPMNFAPRPDYAEVIFESVRYEVYDAKLTPDNRYLFAAHAHSWMNGVSRIDLDSGQLERVTSDDVHAHYIELFPNKNLAIVNASRYVTDPETGEEKKLGRLYYYSMEPLALTGEKICDLPYPIRSARYVDDSLLLISKGVDQSVNWSTDLDNPCENMKARIELPEGMSGAETFAFLEDDPELAWIEGEFGGDICLVHPKQGKLLHCFDGGLGVWSTKVEPGGKRLWLSRQTEHKVDIRDARSGEWIGSIPINGAPRPIAFDPRGGFAYVGTYITGHVAVIDTKSLEILRYIRSGYRLRELLVDEKRRRLLAISAEGIYAFSLERLHAG